MSINPEEIMRLMKQLKQWMVVASIGLMAFSVAASPTEPAEGVEYQRLQTRVKKPKCWNFFGTTARTVLFLSLR